eukprot:COSAG02_NODE_35784_length_463_cov_1.131868_1_plen_105_part_10
MSVTPSSSFAEMVTFMREEREQAKSERAEMEARLESKLAEQKAQMEEQKKATVARVEHTRIEQQLPALQARIEALHAAQLLTDDELLSIEDVIADLEAGSDDTRV